MSVKPKKQLRGKPKSKKHRRKIGLAHRGMKRSAQTKYNMSKNHADFKGDKNPRAKLTPSSVHQIQQQLESGISSRDIAKTFNVSLSTIKMSN